MSETSGPRRLLIVGGWKHGRIMFAPCGDDPVIIDDLDDGAEYQIKAWRGDWAEAEDCEPVYLNVALHPTMRKQRDVAVAVLDAALRAAKAGHDLPVRPTDL